MKEKSYYMRRYRKKYSIQVNKLKLEINGIQFGKIAKILHLQELNIEPEPNLVFCVYNLGIQKDRLKTLGGYSYTPSVAKEENPFAKPAEPRKYHPNFLSPFGIPEASEQEPQQEELGQEPIKQEDKKRGGSNAGVWCSKDKVWKYPTNKCITGWTTIKGVCVSPPVAR